MASGEPEELIGKKSLGLAPPNINVTPLVDVLLVLLIIFFVIQPRKEAKFETPMPEKNIDETKIVPPRDPLVVVVKDGIGMAQNVELNTRPLTLPELANLLRDELNQRPNDKTVFIKAPKDKFYGDVVAVVDVVKGAGAKPIGLDLDYIDALQ